MSQTNRVWKVQFVRVVVYQYQQAAYARGQRPNMSNAYIGCDFLLEIGLKIEYNLFKYETKSWKK